MNTRSKGMPAAVRKLILTAHVTCSVGWIGAVAAFLALAVGGLIGRDTHLAQSVYVAMRDIAWVVIVPLAFASLVTGVIASLGTSWGLFRYYWIVFKLLVTSLAIVILMVHMQPIDALAAATTHADPVTGALRQAQRLMVIASILAIVALVFATSLSLYKPRGITPWRVRDTSRGAAD